jgi:tyrosine-protein kinase Etk/Wzc
VETQPVAPKQLSEERTLLEGLLHYLSILIRYKWLIAIITFTAATAVVIFSVATLSLPLDRNPLPNKYTAYAVLLVQSEESGMSALSSVLSSLGAGGGGGSVSYGDVGLQVLSSRPTLDTLVEEFSITDKYEITQNIRTGSREAILSRSDFVFDTNTGSLTISYTDVDPFFSRDIVNRMVALLEGWFTEWGGTANQRQITLLEEKIAEVSAEITRLEGELESLQLLYGIISVTEIASAQAAILTDLRSQLMQVDLEIKNYARYSTIEDEALVRLKLQKEGIEGLISETERGYTGGKKTMPSREELPKLSVQFARLQVDLEIQMRIYQSINEQYELLKLSSETGTIFDILEYAEAPDEKSEPSRGQLSMVVTALAFFGSIVIAFLLNMINNIRKDPSKRKLLAGEGKS